MLGFPQLDPYEAAIKIGLKITAVAAIIILLVYGYYKIDALEAELTLANTQRDLAIEAADEIVQNNIYNDDLYRQQVAENKQKAIELAKAKDYIHHVATHPVKKECEETVADFWAPIGASFEFVRTHHDLLQTNQISTPTPTLFQSPPSPFLTKP